MCGIMAWINPRGVDKNTILLGGVATQERGEHGAGVYTFEKGVFKTIKSFSDDFDAFVRELPEKSKIGILHDRYKTHGDISVENTHPFEYEDWIMAHNGVVHEYSKYGKAKDMFRWIKKNRKGKTDSEFFMLAIMHQMYVSQYKIKQAINTALDAFWGYYTIALTNKRSGSMYLFGNHDRCLIKHKTRNETLFFSTRELAKACVNIEQYKTIEMKSNFLYRITAMGELEDMGFLKNGASGKTSSWTTTTTTTSTSNTSVVTYPSVAQSYYQNHYGSTATGKQTNWRF